jgi:hypothetical protein
MIRILLYRVSLKRTNQGSQNNTMLKRWEVNAFVTLDFAPTYGDQGARENPPQPQS